MGRVILPNAKWIDGMEVGGEYTYVRVDGGIRQEVDCKIISIEPEGTCTVEVLTVRETPIVIH